MSRIAVILPTLNERGNIIPLIEAVRACLRGWDHEILVIDDDSRDGTAALAQEKGGAGVRVIVRREDHGLARSIRCGIEATDADVLLVMDSDFNHDPSQIPAMLEQLPAHDVVSASRSLPGGRMVPAWRGVCSHLFNLFVRLATGSRMTDHLFGFMLMRRSALAGCPMDGIFIGFGDYAIRLFVHWQKKGVRIVEVPGICGLRRAGLGNQRLVAMFFKYTMTVLRVARQGRV